MDLTAPEIVVVGSRPDCQFLNGWVSHPVAQPAFLARDGLAVLAYGWLRHDEPLERSTDQLLTVPEAWRPSTDYGVEVPVAAWNESPGVRERIDGLLVYAWDDSLWFEFPPDYTPSPVTLSLYHRWVPET